MSYKIADTHTHLYFSAFDGDQDDVVRRCDSTGVGLQVQIGCDEVSTLAAIELAKKYPHFYATVGLHPCDVKTCFDLKKDYRPAGYKDYQLQAHNFDELFHLFDSLIHNHSEKIVGLGETGFDLYHENSLEIYHLQQECFDRHVSLAEKHNKPLVIHIRNARQEFLSYLEQGRTRGLPAVVHCFSEDAKFAKIMTENYGFFLGIGGVATYPKSDSIREAIKKTPIEFLLTETDAPFLVPHTKRKQGEKRNDSSYLPEIVRLIAELKGMDEVECGNILFENAKRFYTI